jgi:hypothetical protein
LINYPTSEKWTVVTSVNEPNDQVKELSKQVGFKLLVIGDKKTNPQWSLNNTIFLSIQNQKELEFKLFNLTPFNSYTRKNIGYLFAIKQGAKFIYDTEDKNLPTVDINKFFNFKDNDLGLIYDHRVRTRVPNLYAHFGQPMI